VTVRRLVVVLLLLVAVLAVLDRVGADAAERAVAERIQRDQGLAVRPDVSIHGFPFMTQLIAGDYDEVDVTVHELGTAGVVHVSRLTAHLFRTHVPFGDVVEQDVERIPVDRATADVVVDFGALNDFLAGRQVTLSAADGRQVHVEATVAGAEVSTDVAVTVERTALLLSLPGGAEVRMPLPQLPFGVRLESVGVEHDGLVVTGSARDLVLRT
jgi:hypothetical protein